MYIGFYCNIILIILIYLEKYNICSNQSVF